MADSYKVALASTDGQNVNTHYGRAQAFYVYRVNDEEGYDFVEERTVTPLCSNGSHLVSQMQESTARFCDCKYVVASREIRQIAIYGKGGIGKSTTTQNLDSRTC